MIALTISNDDRDRVAELLDLEQQRRLERADAGEQLVDAAEFGVGFPSRRRLRSPGRTTTSVPE